MSGLPAIVVPAGLGPDGLPLAMEILGLPFSERALLTIAQVVRTAPRPAGAAEDDAAYAGGHREVLTVQDFNGLRFVPDTKCSRSPATGSLLTRLVQ